jgi:hypothetical protein
VIKGFSILLHFVNSIGYTACDDELWMVNLEMCWSGREWLYLYGNCQKNIRIASIEPGTPLRNKSDDHDTASLGLLFMGLVRQVIVFKQAGLCEAYRGRGVGEEQVAAWNGEPRCQGRQYNWKHSAARCQCRSDCRVTCWVLAFQLTVVDLSHRSHSDFRSIKC